MKAIRGGEVPKANGPVPSTCRTAEKTGAWDLPAPSGCHHLLQLMKLINSPSAIILKIKWEKERLRGISAQATGCPECWNA